MERYTEQRRSDTNSVSTASDSGVGRSFHSHTVKSSRTTSINYPLPTAPVQQQLFHSFNHDLWYSHIPTAFQPTSTNQLDFITLWCDTTRVEAWLLEKMAAPTTTEKIAVDAFFQDVKLFAVRCGPPQLLRALHNLGLLHSGEQLANGFTAFQTAAMWRNSDVIFLFGHGDAAVVYRQLEENPDGFEYFSELSPLDCAAFQHTPNTNCLLGFLKERETFDFTTLAILIRTQSTITGGTVDGLFLGAVGSGQNMFADVLLCMFGADIGATETSTGNTCLHIAALEGHLSLIELLLRRNANPNVATPQDELPEDMLPRALKKRVVEILSPYRKERFEQICGRLSAGKSLTDYPVPADFATTDEEGRGILAIAVEQGNVNNLVRLLASPGSSINAQNSQTGRSVLSEAVARGDRQEVIRLLLEHGAQSEVRDFAEFSALDIAIEQDDRPIVEIMMAYPQCWAGLHAAMRRSKSAEMTRLLQTAFKRRQAELVLPALFSATTDGDAELLNTLGVLEAGDSVNVCNNLGESPAFVAAKNGRTAALQVIVELGGNFWSRHAQTFETTIHVAAAGGHSDTIRFLAECFRKQKRTINIDGMDNNGKTALHRAAENGHTEAARTLLDLGASPNGYSSCGVLLKSKFESMQSVLDEYRLPRQILVFRSIDQGNLKTLRAVWESPLDHYLRNHMGDTPIMVAAQLGNTKIIDFLLETADQEYRPYEVDLNVKHDANIDCILQRKESRPDLASPPQTDNVKPISRHRPNSHQWIFGRINPALPEVVPTLFIDDHRLNHVSSTNLNDGCCAIHRAIEAGDNVEVVRRLINKDPYCVNIPEHNGFTALHLSVVLCRPRIVRFLLKLEGLDFYATDMFGRLPEELADTPRLLEMIRTARTQPSSRWAAMCDEEIPLSTADGLSNWTNQFTSIHRSESGGLAGAAGLGSSAQLSLFAGKTSASQDGVYEYIDRSRSARDSKSAKEPTVVQQPPVVIPKPAVTNEENRPGRFENVLYKFAAR